MRILEILFLSVAIIAMVILVFTPRKRPSWLVYLAWLGSALFILHLLIEGYRWQMVPAYALAGWMLVLGWWQARRVPVARQGWRRVTGWIGKGLGALLVLLWAGVAVAVPYLVPVFDLPAPSGEYSVGRAEWYFTDDTRPEVYTDDPEDVRQLKVTVWYPAVVEAGLQPDRYWEAPRLYGTPLTRSLGLPEFLFDHLRLVRSSTYAQAPVAEAGQFPVLLFSHGLNVGFGAQNSFQMEELASHGYVIFSIDHPYESLVVNYPDGRLAYSRDTKPLTEEIQIDYDRYLASETPDSELRPALEGMLRAGTGFDNSIHIWVEDTEFVLSQIETQTLSPDHIFYGRLDLEQIGVFGHSYGGAAATLFCLENERCGAALNMDGMSFGHELLTTGLEVPYLMFYSDDALITARRFNQFVFDSARADAYELRLLGSKHSDFTDFTLFSPVFRWVGFLGANSGIQLAQSVNGVVLAFFDKYIQGKAIDLTELPGTAYPLVKLIAVKP